MIFKLLQKQLNKNQVQTNPSKSQPPVFSKQAKIIVGLGNMGKRYKKTRHNAGFLWLDYHFGKDGYEYYKYGNYYFKHSTAITHSGKTMPVILVKPSTMMNRSGQAVLSALEKEALGLEDLIVVHDDVDLEIGSYKYSCNRGSGGHNGLRSINQSLNTKKYCRLRLGVRPKEVSPATKANSYVLSKFRNEELEKLLSISTENLFN